MISKTQKEWDEISNSEYRAVMPFCEGNGLNVCCGARVFPNAVGVDLRAMGEETEPWGYKSMAHIKCDCMNLMFSKDNFWDFVVGIHSIEHFVNAEATLQEWLRVLKLGGHLCLIVPDRRYTPQSGDEDHDFTHFREYDPYEFRLIIESVTGVEIVQYDTMANEWSFDCVVRKVLSEKSIELVDSIVDEYSKTVEEELADEGTGKASE